MEYRRISIGDFKIGPDQRKAVNDVLDSGRLSEGPRVSAFEQAWANYAGVKYCVAVSSGAAALILSLTVMRYLNKIKGRKKVITSPLTYIADASAIDVTGFEPVFVDIDPITFCLTPETVAAALKKEKGFVGLIPVDLMGYCCDYLALQKLADKYKLFMIEDAAEAHGSIYKNKPAGSWGNAGIFSFYIAHNLQVGEMGAVTTNNKEIWRLARKLKAQGRACECLVCTRAKGFCPQLKNYRGSDDFEPRFTHDYIGYNFKTIEFQAALALSQINKADEIFKKRLTNVEYLNQRLEKYRDILQLPKFDKKVSYLAYPLVIKNPKAITRKYLRQALEKYGVETRPLFGCIPTQQPAYKHLKKKYQGKLPNAEYIGKNGLYLGCHQYLTKEDLDFTVCCLDKILSNV